MNTGRIGKFYKGVHVTGRIYELSPTYLYGGRFQLPGCGPGPAG